MRLQQKGPALRVFEQQRAAASCWNDCDKPLNDRLKQSVEFGLLAKPQRQLVEESEGLGPCRSDRLPGLEDGCGSIDRRVDIETSIVGGDEGPVIRVDARIETGLGGGDLYRDRRVADADCLAGLDAQLPLTLDLLPVEFRPVGTAEVFDPVLPIRYRDARMRSRHPQVRG